MINYLIEVSVCLAAFYACYWFGLSKLKLLNFNRAYLLLTLVLSLGIPLLNLSLYELESGISPDIPDYISVSTGEVAAQVQSANRINPVLLVYLTGVAITLIALLLRILSVLNTIRKYPRKKFGRVWHIYVPDDRPVSSFFKYMFIPEGLDKASFETQSILRHEEKHARDRHSLDLIFTQLISTLLWFNPLIYLYTRALKLQHEYIADEAVSGKCGKKTYADLLVRYSLEQSGFSLTHSFAEHPVEKRLNMINHLNPTTMKKLRLLWSLPLTFLLTLLLGVDHQAQAQTLDVEFEVRSDLKLVKGNVRDGELGETLSNVTIFILNSRNKELKNANNRYSGTMTNTEGNYGLGMGKSDSLIVFRKKGYESMVVPYKGQDVINVNLRKETASGNDGND